MSRNWCLNCNREVGASHACAPQVRDLRGANEEAERTCLEDVRNALASGRFGCRPRSIAEGAVDEASADLSFLEELSEEDFKKMDADKLRRSRRAGPKFKRSEEPRFSTIGFGKHAGKTLGEIAEFDAGYLEWILREGSFGTPEMKADIETVLDSIGGRKHRGRALRHEPDEDVFDL